MKFSYAILLYFLSVTSLFSQELIKHSTLHFKDSTIVQGDFYYYPLQEQSVTLMDSLGEKQVYDLALVDFIEGNSELFKVLNFDDSPRLFETLVKGKKASLYQRTIANRNQFFVLKENQVIGLEGGNIELERNGQKFSKENNRYKGILKFLLRDNSYVMDKVDNLQYAEKSLIPLFMAYNNGYVFYVKISNIKEQERIPNWKLYAQYSNWRNTPSLEYEYAVSDAFQAGAQYFISKGSQHSVKFGFEYGQYNTSNTFNGGWWNLNTSYYYDVFRMSHGNVYLGARIFDIGKANTSTYDEFYLQARLSPLLGYEHHIDKRTDLYIELNQLLLMGTNPLNFSFGFSFNL